MRIDSRRAAENAQKKLLFGVNSEVNVHCGAAVELAYGLAVALATIVLSVEFVIGVEGGRWETVLTVLAYDVGFDRARAGVGQVHDGARQGVLLLVDDAAGQEASRRVVLGGCAEGGCKAQQKQRDRKSTRLNSSHRCISYAV